MKRSTVVHHLDEMADAAHQLADLTVGDDVPRLLELWVGGDLTSAGQDVEHVVAILVLEMPATDLPEIARPAAEAFYGRVLRLDKRPAITRSRPTNRPAWSHLERRVVRFWSVDTGPDAPNIAGLRRPDLDGVDVVEPTESELRSWLSTEIPRSSDHLRSVLNAYWDPSWRRDHHGGDLRPEDHLWRAAWAVQSMRDALTELEQP